MANKAVEHTPLTRRGSPPALATREGSTMRAKTSIGCALIGGVSVLTLDATSAAAQTEEGAGTTKAMTASSPVRMKFAQPWTSPYRVDPQRPHHFVNSDGAHLFVMNKTAWAFFGCRDPQGYLERAKAQGISVIRVALEGRPYFTSLGIDLWPWGGTREMPDFGSFNESYWNEVERRVQLAGQMGIGLNVVLYFTLRPANDAAVVHEPYWQRAIDRLGRHANVFLWEIQNEYLGEPDFQDAAGTWFVQHDPHGRPVCTSDGTARDAAWPDKRWVSVAINHSCTGSGVPGGRDHKAAHTLDGWYLRVARNTRSHGKPAFCNESGREKRHKNDDGVHRRKQGWLWCAAGAYWTWHSWDGCEGIDDAKYKAPGAEFVEPMARFFRSIPFYDLEPTEHLLTVSEKSVIHTTLVDAHRTLVVAYLCVEQTHGRVKNVGLQFALPTGSYRTTLINPCDLRVIASGALPVDGHLDLPEFSDDLVVKVERIAEK
jgi:hypothetical protein